MTFAEKLKELRKNKAMSQETLAEKLHVSRQAITKWENGTGLPDIENIVAIGALFNESLDNLLSNEKSLLTKHEFLYESRTEYDLDEEKRIDFNFGTAHEVIVEQTTDEKIQVLAASNKINEIQQMVKVKIKENSRAMDVKIKTSTELSSSLKKTELFIIIKIPHRFVAHMELKGYAENLRVRDIQFYNLEVGGKFHKGFISNSTGHIELDINSIDLDVEVSGFKGKIDFNQMNTTSILRVKNGNYHLRRVGLRNRFVDRNDKEIPLERSKGNASWKELTSEKQLDFIVEVAGIGAELKIEN
ncbi:MAG: helix-turn-helix transcriptional regulator [Treponema sp.]|nr:helix-turn-helix transcriptional regulator [Candidatus Treponema equifaecale]